MSEKTHNLNVHMYSFEELLGLFNLSYDISIDDLKRAKKVVLMTHPDKSRLPPDYFLFYKKAFDIIVQFYENQQRQNRVVPKEEQKYEPIKQNDLTSSTNKKVSKVIQTMSTSEFQQKFNALFEQNMSQKPDATRNEWFTKDEPVFKVDEQVNASNMGRIFEQMKDTHATTVMSTYRGVENLYMQSGPSARLYGDDDDDGQYVSCDPFSKLKFDDLRKVHKDQTVFAVSEKDIHKTQRYASTEQLMQARGAQTLTPVDKANAEQMLSAQERQYREQMMKREHAAKLQTMKYEEKNKSVLSSFLMLQ